MSDWRKQGHSQRRRMDAPSSYLDGALPEEEDRSHPSLAVCPHCNGNGLEPGSGISFTASDLDEWGGGDHEYRRDLGRAWSQYGMPCTNCEGNKVVTHANYDNYVSGGGAGDRGDRGYQSEYRSNQW